MTNLPGGPAPGPVSSLGPTSVLGDPPSRGASVRDLAAHGAEAAAGAPLYVHLPLCAAKCNYCDFFSVADHGQDRQAIIQAILREAELRAPHRPSTVFLGGGTPSLFSEAELQRLLDGLDAITDFRRSAVEVTAECNPESLDAIKARALLDLGVTRLSIGFQSLRDDVLRFFGRVHDASQSFRAFEAAREAGVNELNVDLIYATPGQTPREWEEDLLRVLALEPEHLSAYNLSFEDGTPLNRWKEEGLVAKHSDEVELELFWITRRVAAAHGFRAYEVSNFSRPGSVCLHNVNYWENGAYVGIGPSAVSKVANARSGNVRALAPYLDRISHGRSARDWEETLDSSARLRESWWLGLRLAWGVDPRALVEANGCQGADPCAPIAETLVGDGLLETAGSRVKLTDRGLVLADYVGSKFLDRGSGPA